MNKSQEILSQITIFQKYAKFIPELNRRENWEEIVQRNIAMHVKKYPQLKDEIQSVYKKFVMPKKVLASMRSFQFAGSPIELANNRMFNCSYMTMDDPHAFNETMFLLLGGSGVGYSVQKRHTEKLPIVECPKATRRRFLVGDSIEGWADAVKVLMESYFYGKADPDFDYRDIRPKGARLVTSGGKAPGPDPLRICIDKIRSVLNGACTRQLTPLEIHDIMCHIADAVLSGGIRRAAMISLFDKDDMDMLTCKSGAWWELNPQRGRANNSVALDRANTTKEEFNTIWERVMLSGAGEPGVYWTNNLDWGTNPCVSGDALITVCDHGVDGGVGVPYKIPMRMLVEQCQTSNLLPSALTLNEQTGQHEWKQVLAGQLTKCNAEVVRITYNDKSVVCTPDHKIYTKNRGWTEAKDLLETDELEMV